MAKEIEAKGQAAGITLFALIQRAGGDYWTGTGNNFAGSASITVSSAAVALTADATFTHNYAANFPTAITTPGTYTVTVYQRAGGSPAASDLALPVTLSGDITWSGTAAVQPAVTLADGAITDAKFTFTADPSSVVAGPIAWIQAIAARLAVFRRVKKDHSAHTVTTYRANGTTPWFTNSYTATGNDEDVHAAL